MGTTRGFRVATLRNHINRNGTIHHALFKGGVTSPRTRGKAWRSEISGRLLSLADDVARDAEQRVARKVANAKRKGTPHDMFEFRGLACGVVRIIRGFSLDRTDVVYEPEPDDNAHANTTFQNTEPAQIYSEKPPRDLTFINEFIKLLRVVWPADIGRLSGGDQSDVG